MREKTPVPFGEWAPDRSKIAGQAYDARGVLSISGKYAPLPDASIIRPGSQINDHCLGGFTAYDSGGNPITFLADSGRIYRLNGKMPADVSRSGGYDASLDWAWSFCQFGNNVLAIARGEPLQRYIIGSSSVFADVGTAPTGDCVFRIRNQVFIGDGATVNASAFNDLTDWTPSPSTQSFINEVNQARGLIVSGWGGEQGVIFQERGMIRLNFIGGAAPYQFDDIEGGRGLCGPNAWAEWGRRAYCVAEDGFYVTDGMEMQPLGEGRVDREFSTNLNYGFRHRVWSAIDAKRKSWMIGWPSEGRTTCDQLYIYSWADNRWTHDEIDTAYGFEMHRDPVDADDEAGIIALFGTADADDAAFADVSVDSSIWRENRKEWGVINGDRQVCQFTGANRAATLSTGTFEPILGRKTFVSELWPTTDAATDEVTGQIAYRLNRLGETETVSASAAMNEEGFCPVTGEGRYVRGIVNIAAGSDWTEALGVQTDAGDAGEY